MAKISLSSPWVEYYRKVNAMFQEDPEVTVVYDEEKRILNIYVDNSAKAGALGELFPVEKIFGNCVLKINIIPSNRTTTKFATTVLEEVLDGNGAVSFIKKVALFGKPLTYVVFKPEVIQYFTDDLSDYHGFRSTLYAEIAKELFDELDGVYFCTDLATNNLMFGMPLGEWP